MPGAQRGRLVGVLGSLDDDDVEAVQRWLDHPGTNIEDTELQTNKTALIYASAVSSSKCVQLLVDAGANLHATNSVGCSAAFAAAQQGSTAALKILIGAGADPRVSTNTGTCPLHVCSKNGHLQCVQLLLGVGDPNLLQLDGANAAYIAADAGQADALSLLLKAGIDPNRPAGDRSCTPLWAAAEAGFTDCVQALLLTLTQQSHSKRQDRAQQSSRRRFRLDLNATCNVGSSPLYIACQNGHAECVQLLLQAGASLELSTLPTVGGFSALHIASQQGHTQCVQLLLSSSPPDLLSAVGYTALDLTFRSGNVFEQGLLRAAGAVSPSRDPKVLIGRRLEVAGKGQGEVSEMSIRISHTSDELMHASHVIVLIRPSRLLVLIQVVGFKESFFGVVSARHVLRFDPPDSMDSAPPPPEEEEISLLCPSETEDKSSASLFTSGGTSRSSSSSSSSSSGSSSGTPSSAALSSTSAAASASTASSFLSLVGGGCEQRRYRILERLSGPPFSLWTVSGGAGMRERQITRREYRICMWCQMWQCLTYMCV
jgi:ankyrin repeat protein